MDWNDYAINKWRSTCLAESKYLFMLLSYVVGSLRLILDDTPRTVQ